MFTASTGLSFVANTSCYVEDENQAMDQLMNGLIAFYSQHPEYSELDLYIFGESYAGTITIQVNFEGKYIPEVATKIMHYNKQNQFQIPLVGLGIGDGFTNPYVQESTYGEYAYHMGLIDISSKSIVENLIVNCQIAINETLPVPSREADQICDMIGTLE